MTERGLRTRAGKPFNVPGVLSILRNRAYIGEIFFRGAHYAAPHEPLVDPALFERAQEVLSERSEDISLRRTNRSEYLLTGLVKCARCGKRYVGASAKGNGGRYRYYVCFSRQRYGKDACDGDRLPADELEEAILGQLVAVLERESLVREAISSAFDELEAEAPQREEEIARIDVEAKRSGEALDRYFRAFEVGSMPESACAPRIDELSGKLRGLKARREELGAEEPEDREPLSDEDIALLVAHVREVIADGDAPTRKALLQSPVEDPGRQPRGDLPIFFFARGSTTVEVSAPSRIRTCGLSLRRGSLYPAELSGPGLGFSLKWRFGVEVGAFCAPRVRFCSARSVA